MYVSAGRSEEAIGLHNEALTIFRAIGDRQWEANTLGNLGSAYGAIGDHFQAVECYKQDLAISREFGDARGEGSLTRMGTSYVALGKYKQALGFYEHAASLTRKTGNSRSEGHVLWHTGIVLDNLGRRDEAIEHCEQALKIFTTIEDLNAGTVKPFLAVLAP